MISALAWVPRGAAALLPKVDEPTEAELEMMKQQAGLEEDDDSEGDWEEESDNEEDDDSMDDEDEDPAEQARAAARAIKEDKGRQAKAAKKASKKASKNEATGLDDELAGLMADYDDDDGDGAAESRIFGGKIGVMYTDTDDDPYVTLKGEEDVDEDEIEDFNLKDSDLIFLAARNEDDVSHVEVWVYEEDVDGSGGNMYVHHDLMLPAFPLSLAWMDVDPRGGDARGNFVAISTMSPEIEIWDLDTVDSVEPVGRLGGEEAPSPEAVAEMQQMAAGVTDVEGLNKEERKKLKAKIKKQQEKLGPRLRPGSHRDAVLCLAWNSEYRNVLASGSADKTVKVWDIVKGVPEHTLTHHTGKVQAVAWNPVEAPVLLSGGFDQRACLADLRQPGAGVAEWKLSADVEALAWDPHDPQTFVVCTEDGVVSAYDTRRGTKSKPRFTLAAHDKPTCGLSFHSTHPGVLATCSVDKKVKIWDVSGSAPSLVAQKDLKVGAVFATAWCKDSPWLIVAGGAKGVVTVWDTMSEEIVKGKWGATSKDMPDLD